MVGERRSCIVAERRGWVVGEIDCVQLGEWLGMARAYLLTGVEVWLAVSDWGWGRDQRLKRVSD